MGTLLVERYVPYENVPLWDVSVDRIYLYIYEDTTLKLYLVWELLGSVLC